jgi:uncharacterized membrane protein YeaQ/YmgE (transglycosylase-associated protein family)
MLGFLIVLVVMGLIIGLLARLLIPGEDPMSLPATLALGVVGTLISGLIGRAFFGADGRFGSWLFALVITIILVLLVRRFAARRGTV